MIKLFDIIRGITLTLLLICCNTVWAYDIEVDGIYYNITSTADLTVEVTSGDNEYSGDIVIPSTITYKSKTLTVTSIGYSAFSGCSGLASITIPNSVTSIGDYAFDGCTGLTSITIPNSVTSIGEWAFQDCSGLTSITIPNSVTSIGSGAFWDCTGLKSITIPNSVTSIEWSAFQNCTGLTSIEIPNSVTSIGNYAFYGCTSLASVEIGNSVTSIGSYAFYGCTSLASVEIGNSVTSIGSSAFRDCTGLTSITIPNSVTSIENYSFEGCTLLKDLRFEDGTETLNLGYNYAAISYALSGEGLFYDCPLETLYLGRNLSYNSRDQYGSSPFYRKKTLTSITIGNSVTSIGYSAFEGCSGLTSITIPNSVTSIGGGAFSGCTGLKEVHISDISAWYSISFLRSGSNPLHCAHNLYLNGELVTEIEIPKSVKSLKSYVFAGCLNITNVVIPNNVTSIENDAFSGCSDLTSIKIPNSVTSIGNFVFDGCTSLKDLCIEDGEGTLSLGYGYSYSSSSGMSSLFYTCPLETLYLGRKLSYQTGSYYEYSPFYNKTTLKSVSIGNCVTSIGESAFDNCASLEYIYVMAETPPSFYDSSFTKDHYMDAVLYVPIGCLEAYQNADKWRNFWDIREFDTTGLCDVKTETKDSIIVYDLNGRVVENPTKGVYIVDGKKMLIK